MPTEEIRVPGDDERDLPDVQVPATADGVRYELTDLSRLGQGEEYVALDVTNGGAVPIEVVDNTGRVWRVRSGMSRNIDVVPGVTYLAVVPRGGAIAAAEVILIPTVRRPLHG